MEFYCTVSNYSHFSQALLKNPAVKKLLQSMVLKVTNNTGKMGNSDGASGTKRKADESDEQPPHKTVSSDRQFSDCSGSDREFDNFDEDEDDHKSLLSFSETPPVNTAICIMRILQ